MKEIEKKKTGVVIPLGALYTKDSAAIGEYPDLKAFGDFCKASNLDIIQLLPVNDTGTQSSPYSGLSAFALHPIYIRIKDIPNFESQLKSDKKLNKLYSDFCEKYKYSPRYNYDGILNDKIAILKQLYEETEPGKTGKADEELSKWIKANSWVKIYAVYKNLKWNYMQASWKSWHENDQHKTEEEILGLWNKMAFKKEHLFYAWIQMIAERQFSEAVSYVHSLGIKLKGDMPILMNEDSCDAWAYPQFFNQNLRAGSPADGGNPAGQNWGFPTYNWKNLKAENYSWWKKRLIEASKYYDAYRLDHILGFFRIWAIPDSDCNALTGHTEPYAAIKREDLYVLGFDDNRIRWLSKPHIPTGIVEDITWNHEAAHNILKLLCTKIDGEELWLFNSNVKGSAQIANTDFGELCNEEAAVRIKNALIAKWSDITLLETAKNKFVPLWTYGSSTSWGTLNENEKSVLQECFNSLNEKNEKLWKKQADEIFEAITKAVKMIPCGEDLGINIECVPQTMKEHAILGLRVVRWCRKWGEAGQPYVPFADYEPLSVTTTSVHDSSTLREWWEEEKESVKAFILQNADFFGIETGAGNGPLFTAPKEEIEPKVNAIADQQFSPEIAQNILKASATAASQWFIPPLQDFIYMDKSLWLDKASNERINVPGTVTDFNWTYRLPLSLEDLLNNKKLIEKIQNISRR